MVFHYVYKTTCLVTDFWYIGVHSTRNLFDEYLGSGIRLQRSVEKYGADNHERVWLKFFDTREEAFAYEAEIITEKFISTQPLCMNLKPGGSGGFASSQDQVLFSIKGANKRAFLYASDPDWVAKTSQALSQGQYLAYEKGTRIPPVGWNSAALEAAQSAEARAKRKESQAKINHQQGSKNSQFRTCWVSNSTHTIKIKLELLDEYKRKGYTRGRKLS